MKTIQTHIEPNHSENCACAMESKIISKADPKKVSKISIQNGVIKTFQIL